MFRLTIIIPTYNAAKFIPELTKKLVQLDDVEVLFVDDGSSDETIRLIEAEYQNLPFTNDVSVRVVKSDHKGVSKSRNIGIKAAQGEYITFIDADDLFSVENLAHIIDSINDLYEDVIYFQKEFKNTTINLDDNDYRNEIIDALVLKKEAFQQDIIQTAPWAKLFKTDFIQKFKIYFPEDVQFGEDLIFNVECLKKAKIVSFNSLGFYKYRNNLNSVSNKVNYDVISNSSNFFKHLKRLLGSDSETIKKKVARSIINDSKRAIKGGKSNVYIKTLVDTLSVNEYSDIGLSRKQKLVLKVLIKHHFIFFNLLVRNRTVNKTKVLYQNI